MNVEVHLALDKEQAVQMLKATDFEPSLIHWQRKQGKLASTGELLFTSEQAGRIRAAIGPDT